jgi:hypothetical protein
MNYFSQYLKRNLIIFSAIVFCLASSSPQIYARTTGNVFYAAPNGTAGGSGSINSPWDLKTALGHPSAVNPGDTIYLRGGNYRFPSSISGYTSDLTGTAASPIIVRSYPGEWAVIDGNLTGRPVKNVAVLTISGNYTWFRDFEITNTEPEGRKLNITGSNPPERRGEGIHDRGDGNKVINLIIHDTGQGIASYSHAENSEYYGNVVYHNGWDAPDRTHGHGSYVQNNSDFKKFENNIFFNAFRNNTQMYGSSNAFCYNFIWIGNIMFNGGQAWWGPNIKNLIVRENYYYNQHFKLGNNVNPTNLDADVQNNYFMDGASFDEFTQNLIFRNNSVWYDQNDPVVQINAKNFLQPGKFNIDNNTYYKGRRIHSIGHFRIAYNGNKARNFAFNKTTDAGRYAVSKKSWQDDLSFDQNGTWIESAPTGKKVFVRPNKYDPERAHIVVYNWDLADTVAVNPGSVLSSGDEYELRNVQNYFGDVITGTYTGGAIQINMNGRSRIKPIGYNQVSSWYHDPLKPNTFPRFGVFVLIKKN